MVRIAEIINRTPGGDNFDKLIDGDMANIVYEIYNELITISDNFYLLSYELSSRNLQHELTIIKDPVLSTFPPASTARKMVEEMIQYFEWF